MLKHLLVALDDTRDSRVALQHAVDLAEAERGRLHLVTVAEDEAVEPELTADTGFGVDLAGPASAPELPVNGNFDADDVEADGRLGTRPVLESAREICEQRGVLAATSVLAGRPSDRLSRKLRTADALIVGRGGSSASGERPLGLCTREVVRHARKPVLVAGHEYYEPNGVLSVYDGTEAGQRALQVAGELCDVMSRGLHVVCCGRGRNEQHRLQDEAHEYLRGYGLTADTRRADSEPVDEIIAAVGDTGVGVMAVPRPEGLVRMLRPTVAERLLEQTKCPVWVVS